MTREDLIEIIVEAISNRKVYPRPDKMRQRVWNYRDGKRSRILATLDGKKTGLTRDMAGSAFDAMMRREVAHSRKK